MLVWAKERGSIAAVRLASHVQSTDFLWPSHVVPEREREVPISTFLQEILRFVVFCCVHLRDDGF